MQQLSAPTGRRGSDRSFFGGIENNGRLLIFTNIPLLLQPWLMVVHCAQCCTRVVFYSFGLPARRRRRRRWVSPISMPKQSGLIACSWIWVSEDRSGRGEKFKLRKHCTFSVPASFYPPPPFTLSKKSPAEIGQENIVSIGHKYN